MYTSKPSKQHKKKGIQIIKNLINSKRYIKWPLTDRNEKVSNQQENSISQSSIKNHFSSDKSYNPTLYDVKISKQQRYHKTSIDNSNPQTQRKYTGSFNILQSTKNKFKSDHKIPESSINNINQSNQKIHRTESFILENQRQKAQLDIIQSPILRNRHQRLFGLTFSNKLHHHKNSKFSNSNNVIPSTKTSLSPNKDLPISLTKDKPQANHHLKSYKDAVTSFIKPSLKPQKHSSSQQSPKQPSKQRTLYQTVKSLQSKLLIQRENIKKTRKDFVDLLQTTKRKMIVYQKQIEYYTDKIDTIQREVQKMQNYKIRHQLHKQDVCQMIQEQTKKLENQRNTFNEFQQQKRQQLQSKIIQNSLKSKKIFILKQQINKKTSYNQNYHMRVQNNKQLVRKIIQKQEHINNLNMEKNIKIYQQKQALKQAIKVQIQNQDILQVYEKLDKQLNLVKEYYKISQNHHQFKRNIKKLTKFHSYAKSIEQFQKDPNFSNQILNIYKKSLWNADMPKFLEAQRLFIQSAQIKELKNQSKQLQLKKQSLNQALMQKQKQVNSLSTKCVRLEQQIQKMIKQNNQIYQVSQSQHTIQWGFDQKPRIYALK